MYKVIPFRHGGVDYEVRAVSDGSTVHVRAFKNNRPANGYSYSIDVLTAEDAGMSGSLIDPLRELIETAKSDVCKGVWDSYVSACQDATNISSRN